MASGEEGESAHLQEQNTETSDSPVTASALRRAIANLLEWPEADDAKLGERIEITYIQKTEGSVKGDGFLCTVEAISVATKLDGAAEEKTYNFMAKISPSNALRKKWLQEMRIFMKEVKVYTELIPNINEVLSTAKLPLLPAPTCYYANLETMVMLLDNLKLQGYRMVSVQNAEVSEAHVLMALDTVALLHASSHHFIQSYPGGVDALRIKYDQVFFHDAIMPDAAAATRESFTGIIVNIFKGAVALIEKVSADLACRMRKFTDTIPQLLAESGKSEEGDFCSIVHGDCWMNNFMFTHDERTSAPVSAKIFDFQFSRYGRAAQDVADLICTSTTPEMRGRRLEALLEHYHARLLHHLQQLGHGPGLYEFARFRRDYDRDFYIGYINGTVCLQALLAEGLTAEGGGLDFDGLESEAALAEAMDRFTERLLRDEGDNRRLVDCLRALSEDAAGIGLI